MKSMKLILILAAQLQLSNGFRILGRSSSGDLNLIFSAFLFLHLKTNSHLRFIMSVPTTGLKMSMDIHSLQSLIHDVPTWAQYAAQGLAAEAVAGSPLFHYEVIFPLRNVIIIKMYLLSLIDYVIFILN
jgi:hypothetical protein